MKKKREILSFLTISFCYKLCTFLSINKSMCIKQKSHQYLRFLLILKNKSFSLHTKVVARNSKSNILGDFLCSKQYIVSPIMCFTTLGYALCESVRQSICGQLVKSMQKGDNVLPNIVLAGHVLLVKMLTE